jgi:hypothetical protein
MERSERRPHSRPHGFLPHLFGRNILLYEDNQAVCYVLAALTSRSQEMMEELRRLFPLGKQQHAHQTMVHNKFNGQNVGGQAQPPPR